MKKMIMLLFVVTMLGTLSLFSQTSEETPIATIYTQEYEGNLSFFVGGEDADIDQIFVDAGYGKKKIGEKNADGTYPVKGDVIKIYGKITALATPWEVTKRVFVRENDHIIHLAITATPLEEQPDLSTCRALTRVSFTGCALSDIDFSKLPASIVELYVSTNKFSEVILPQLPNLRDLAVGSCPGLTKLDVSKASQLQTLDASELPLLSSLDLSNNPELVYLSAFSCNFSTMDLSKCKKLENVALSENQLTEVIFAEGISPLKVLQVGHNRFTSFDTSNMPELISLSLRGNSGLSSIDLSNNSHLQIVAVDNTSISSIDVRNLQELTLLNLGGCPLTTVDISGLENLETFSVQGCYGIESLDFSGCSKITHILLAGNRLGFEASHQMVSNLPNAVEGFIGFFFSEDPKEGNLMHKDDVTECIKKGFQVLQMSKDGTPSPYVGIPANVKKVLSNDGDLTVIDRDKYIEIRLPEVPAVNERLMVFDMSGTRRLSVPIRDKGVQIEKERLGPGAYIITVGTKHVTLML